MMKSVTELAAEAQKFQGENKFQEENRLKLEAEEKKAKLDEITEQLKQRIAAKEKAVVEVIQEFNSSGSHRLTVVQGGKAHISGWSPPEQLAKVVVNGVVFIGAMDWDGENRVFTINPVPFISRKV